MLNIVFGIVVSTTNAVWATNVTTFLPSAVAGLMFGYGTGTASVKDGVVTLDQQLGLLAMIGYVLLLAITATALNKRRDV